MRASSAPLAVMVLATACGDGISVSSPSGLDEPIQVRGVLPDNTTVSQFFEGELPQGTDGPLVRQESLATSGTYATQGERGKKILGNVADGATSVAMRVAGLGTGYWVVPLQGAETLNSALTGTHTFTAVIDVSRTAPTGDYALELAGLDEQGRAGAVVSMAFPIRSLLPTGDLVASLTWDVNADLDLHLIAPDGVDVNPKNLTSLVDPSQLDASTEYPPGVGVLDRDSNAGCTIDSIRMENVVFSSDAPAGEYTAKVDLFSACGQPGVTFRFDVYRSGVDQLTQNGRLLSTQADNGTGPFLLVTKFVIPPK